MDTGAAVIRSSLKLFPGTTSIGADDVEFRLMAELPDVALDQFGGMVKQAISTLSLPTQTLLNMGCLLGKKLGGSRVIAIMGSFYRALMKCVSPKIREWDLEHEHFYDSALAGNSTLRAAVMRALKSENAVVAGWQAGHLL